MNISDLYRELSVLCPVKCNNSYVCNKSKWHGHKPITFPLPLSSNKPDFYRALDSKRGASSELLPQIVVAVKVRKAVKYHMIRGLYFVCHSVSY